MSRLERQSRANSGKVWLEGDDVCHEWASGSWRLRLDEIRVIGEITNQNGPVLDDYFFCFACDATCWFEASFYAEGRNEFLRDLGERLGTEMSLKLLGSTDFASRILWPEHLVNQPMFEFYRKPAETIWQKLKYLLVEENVQTFFSDWANQELSPDALA